MPAVEILIGLQLSTREIKIDIPDDQADALRKQVDDVFASAGNGSAAVLWITDRDGRIVGIPSDKLAYVEIGADKASRAVGFSSRS
jgi:hypothetical protein